MFHNPHTRATVTTALPACAVEFSPSDARILAVGTYLLDPNTQTRSGLLQIYRIVEHRSSTALLSHSLDLHPTVSAATAGIFDVKWDPYHPHRLATAAADGRVGVWHVEVDESQGCGGDDDDDDEADADLGGVVTGSGDGARLTFMGFGRMRPEAGMATTVDWLPDPSRTRLDQIVDDNNITTATSTEVVVSTSGGYLYRFGLLPDGSMSCLSSWVAHDLEAWCVAYDRHHPHILYSGGDDAAFRIWDVRAAPRGGQPLQVQSDADQNVVPGDVDASSPRAVATNRRAHLAGVCCIAPSWYSDRVVATGSYDETVRLWDTRMLSRPVVAAGVGLGGGVWRLKWHPRDGRRLVAAAMHAGFATCQVTFDEDDEGSGGGYDTGEEDAWGRHRREGERKRTWRRTGGLEVEEVYQEMGEGVLGYGADWQPHGYEGGQVGRSLCAVCSFYDKALHLWAPARKGDENEG